MTSGGTSAERAPLTTSRRYATACKPRFPPADYYEVSESNAVAESNWREQLAKP